MIIKFKPKILPKINDVRIRKKFVLFKPCNTGFAICQNIYIKEKFYVQYEWEEKYNSAVLCAQKGIWYNKSLIKSISHWDEIATYLTKEEVFLENI